MSSTTRVSSLASGVLGAMGSLVGCGAFALACGGSVVPGTASDTGLGPDTSTTDASTDVGPTDGGPRDSAGDGDPPPIDAKPPGVIDKVDVLFVVDNSYTMADKQAVLASSINGFFAALTGPGPGKAPVSVHAAVITSSLGSHGTSACATALTNPDNDDRGHLLPRPGSACAGPVVTWEGGAADAAVANVTCLVKSAGQQGCGYEETLEASYHFLSDPAPYAKAEVKCTFGVSGDACGSNDILVEGVDAELLKQRAAFLRPDSVLAVVYLSDENDFSLRPAGKNWLPWGYSGGAMQRGWDTCESIPDDLEPDAPSELTGKGCYSCFVDNKNPNCTKPWAKDTLNADADGRNLRGFHMVQRFGFNFLWSRDRYVGMFKNATVASSDGKPGLNGIFAGGARTAGMVFILPIVGAPPKYVADPTSPNWAALAGVSGRDPHMIESIAPRVGIAKFAGDRTVDATNGGDRDIGDGDELQYACIAPRATSVIDAPDCEWLGADAAKKNPVCDSSSKQGYMRAFPGLRFLRLASSLGPQALAGSVCATSYATPLAALAGRIRLTLK